MKNKIYTEDELIRRKEGAKKTVEKLKEFRQSKEYREKLSNSIKNSKKHKIAVASEESRKKLSNSLKNSKKKKEVMNSEEYKKKRSDLIKGRHAYNNGVKEVFAYSCPEGFVLGSLRNKNKGNKGMHWYNNGEIQICCHEKDCPKGFTKGMLKQNKSIIKV